MKVVIKILLLILCFLSSPQICNAQGGSMRIVNIAEFDSVRPKKFYTYTNYGTTSEVKNYHEFILTFKKGKIGIITKDYLEIFPPIIYNAVWNWFTGQFVVEIDDLDKRLNYREQIVKRMGVINQKGEWVLPPTYYTIKTTNLPKGIYFCETDSKKWGCVNKEGKTVIEFFYNEEPRTVRGKFIELKNKDNYYHTFYSIAKSNGVLVSRELFESVEIINDNKLNKFIVSKKLDGKIVYGIIDDEGKEITQFEFSVITPSFDFERCVVLKNNLYGILDFEGNLLAEPKYTYIKVLSGELMAVKYGEFYAIVNYKGELASKKKYQEIDALLEDFKVFGSNSYNSQKNSSGYGVLNNQKTDISFDIKNFNGQYLILGYNDGSNKVFIKDTIRRIDGVFRYQKKEIVEDAIYKVVLVPDNNFFEIIIDKNNSVFKIETDVTDLEKNLKAISSPENELFFEYKKYIYAYLKKVETANSTEKEKLREEALQYEDEIINKNSSSYLAFWLKNKQPVRNLNDNYTFFSNEYIKSNYFKNFDLTDERLTNTNFFLQKIDEYLTKCIDQEKDAQIKAIDEIMARCKSVKNNYKILLFHLLTKYQIAQYSCWDAIYVHIGKNYYCNNPGIISTDENTLKKLGNICNSMQKIEKFLCGNKAPEIKVRPLISSNQYTISLQNIEAKYKILVIWNLEELKEYDLFGEISKYYSSLKSIKAEVITVATSNNSITAIQTYALKNKPSWVNTIEVDKQVSNLYDLSNKYTAYVLDSDNKIMYKQLDMSQIEKVLKTN